MKLITPKVASDLAAIIADGHAAVAAVLCGADIAGDPAWQYAIDMGWVREGDDPTMLDLHAFGALIAHLNQTGDETRYGTTEREFAAEVRRNPIPRTAREEASAHAALTRGGLAITGLGNRAGATVVDAAVGYSAELEAEMRSTILDAIAAKHGDQGAAERTKQRAKDKGLPAEQFDDQFRSTAQKVKSTIGKLTEDWSRDLDRIVITEGQGAVQRGTADRWKAEEDEAVRAGLPERTLVFKTTRPGACKHCEALHSDGAGNPRIFNLAEVEGNSNIGKKVAEWAFVVGAVHPWCGCPMHRVPRVLKMPDDWVSGESVPSLIGPGGSLVIPGRA